MTLSEFLSCPSGENLLALGEERARLIREVAGVSVLSGEGGGGGGVAGVLAVCHRLGGCLGCLS